MGGAPPPPSSGVSAYVTYQTHAPGYVAVGVPVGEPVLAADRLLVATDTGALRAFR